MSSSGGTQRSNQNRKPFYKGRNNKGKTGNSNKQSKKPEVKKELKFHLHGVGKEKQTATYGKVLEKICLKIQQSYKNGTKVAESLRKGKKAELKQPERKESTKTDPDDKAFHQKTLDMLWNKELELYVERKAELDENYSKAYAFIFEQYCGREMQVALQELEHYETKILNNPLELLKEVRTLMHTPIKARYPFMTLTENLSSFLNLRQTENESLLDYLDRFEQEKNIIKSMLGIDVLYKFTTTHPGYEDLDEDGQDLEKAGSFDAWMACIFLRGGNQATYGELLKDYRKDYANKENSYPKTVRGALDVMRQLKPSKKPKGARQNDKNKNDHGGGNQNKDQDGTKRESSFVQGSKAKNGCWACGKPTCHSGKCDIANNIPRNQWFDKTGIMHFQDTGGNPQDNPSSDN